MGPSPEQLGPENPEEKEAEKEKPIDVLVVFGFGIRSDRDLEEMDLGGPLTPQESATTARVRLPLGAKLRAVAAAELYLRGEVREIIFTGGRVKEQEDVCESEAQLMRDYFEKILKKRWRSELRKTPVGPQETEEEIQKRWTETQPHILLEDSSTNTIENFAHSLSLLVERQKGGQRIALLSNQFHLDRVMRLAKKFQVEGTRPVPAEQITVEARPKYESLVKRHFDPQTNQDFREGLLSALPPEEQGKRLARLGPSMKERLQEERHWSRALDELPQYWLPSVRSVQNPEMLKRILTADNRVLQFLKDAGYDNPDEIPHEELTQILGKIEREMPPAEWGEA